MPAIIEAAQLSRTFGERIAVQSLDLAVAQGELFALLGPNGAGKTTTIALLCTQLTPSSGTARVAGFDIASQAGQVRSRIGLVFQDPSLDEQLTAWENLDFHARIYAMPRALFRQRAAELLALVELADRKDDVVRSFSGGMRRRLELARGLLHQPQVLFLDEPTVGLDPQTRRAIWEYLTALRQRQGVTILLTTHYLEEAEGCDRVAIMDHGRLIALDTPAALKAGLGGDVVSFAPSDADAATRILAARGLAPRPSPNGLIIEVGQGEQFVPELVSLLAASGVQLNSVGVSRPSLEDVFIKLTGRAIRAEEAESNEDLRRRGGGSRPGGRR
jgi:ABC-2 type transport system ATP-binding protein